MRWRIFNHHCRQPSATGSLTKQKTCRQRRRERRMKHLASDWQYRKYINVAINTLCVCVGWWKTRRCSRRVNRSAYPWNTLDNRGGGESDVRVSVCVCDVGQASEHPFGSIYTYHIGIKRSVWANVLDPPRIMIVIVFARRASCSWIANIDRVKFSDHHRFATTVKLSMFTRMGIIWMWDFSQGDGRKEMYLMD